MTQDEIIEMARQTLLASWHKDLKKWQIEQGVEAFAKLVAAKEREACARFSQTLPNPYKHCQISSHAYDMAIVDYSKAIRARGEA